MSKVQQVPDPGGGGGAGSQNSSSASARLRLMPSDFLDSVPHQGTRQCHFTTQQSLNMGAPQSLFVECVEGRKFGAGVSQPSH